MPVAITIRNVPDDVRDELAARAARSGRSLQEYLAQHLIEFASHPTPEDVIAQAREHVRASNSRVTAESILASLREDRER